ncbi:MAG: hypothetical protein EPN26_15865 [Rhodospirillales bacterium]|nr:MAG: hypothetical protein EPN26_15865 [Rhodospirillales bacterium]
MALSGTKVRVQRPLDRERLKRVVLRSRSPGHLRFDLPGDWAEGGAADHLSREMARLEGVYRVLIFARSRKLSIRYDQAACAEAQVIRHLAALVTKMPDSFQPEPSATLKGLKQKILSNPLARWGQEKLEQTRKGAETVKQLVDIKMGKKQPLPFDAKEWGIHFVNDLVAFYLIRVHWERIFRQWLPDPWTYRYQWLTIIYLTTVLVRYRKSSAKKSEAK